jgi:hypothetical protein
MRLRLIAVAFVECTDETPLDAAAAQKIVMRLLSSGSGYYITTHKLEDLSLPPFSDTKISQGRRRVHAQGCAAGPTTTQVLGKFDADGKSHSWQLAMPLVVAYHPGYHACIPRSPEMASGRHVEPDN